MATRWSDTLALVDRSTGDRRRFAEGALDHRALPLPLKWQREESMGHDGSVVVGVIDTLDVDGKGQKVRAEGWFFDSLDEGFERLAEDVAEAKLLAGQGVIGPSIDLEPDLDAVMVRRGGDEPLDFDALMELEDDDEVEVLFTRAKIIGATLVSGPAFEHASTDFQMDEEEEEDSADSDETGDHGCEDGQVWDPDEGECVDEEFALVASVIGSTSLPVGERDRAWSGSGATSRMFDAATGEGGKVNVGRLSRGFLYRDPDADPQTKAAYKLPFADVVDGTLTIIPKGVAATAGGRGVGAAHIPEDEKATIRRKVCTLYGKVRARFDDWPECPFDASEAGARAMVAAMTAADDVAAPPLSFFADPALGAPTALTWTDDGHIFGHIALNATCHTGFSDICVTPPLSSVDHRWFHRYPIETDAGLVWAGRITAGGQHAPLSKAMNATIDHYDSKTVAAYVVVGVDEFGIWVSGALQPDLDEHAMSTLARRKPSGDWRETVDGLELVEILALEQGPRQLSEPGFPIETHLSDGRQTALVACFAPVPRETEQVPGPPADIDYDKLGMAVADAMVRRERTEQRRAELAAAIDVAAKTAVDRARAALADQLVGGR